MTDEINRPARRTRRKRPRLTSPVNLALAAILIGLASFWLGGLRQSDSAGSAVPQMPDFAVGMPNAPGGQGGSDGSGARGEITSLDGDVLYVETADGNTVKVKITGDATVTRNAKSSASRLQPGDTVTVTGATADSGVVKAESVTATQQGVQTGMPDFGAAPGAPGPDSDS